jgi:hypothetical protein
MIIRDAHAGAGGGKALPCRTAPARAATAAGRARCSPCASSSDDGLPTLANVHPDGVPTRTRGLFGAQPGGAVCAALLDDFRRRRRGVRHRRVGDALAHRSSAGGSARRQLRLRRAGSSGPSPSSRPISATATSAPRVRRATTAAWSAAAAGWPPLPPPPFAPAAGLRDRNRERPLSPIRAALPYHVTSAPPHLHETVSLAPSISRLC